jgi:hypothetical protein
VQKALRIAVSYTSLLETRGSSYGVQLLDISATGARVQLPSTLVVLKGEQVVLGNRKARIVRVEGAVAALNFKREIPAHVFSRKRASGSWETLY